MKQIKKKKLSERKKLKRKSDFESQLKWFESRISGCRENLKKNNFFYNIYSKLVHKLHQENATLEINI